MSAGHTKEMTVLNNSQKPGKRETLLPVSLAFQFQGTGKLLGQLGPAEQPCVAWCAWFSLSFCTHCKGMKHCQKTCVETKTPLHTENSFRGSQQSSTKRLKMCGCWDPEMLSISREKCSMLFKQCYENDSNRSNSSGQKPW